LFGYKAIIFYTISRDTTKLAFLALAVLKVGIMNFGCFETGLFGVLKLAKLECIHFKQENA
jgi:hypothetical protein